MATQISRAIPRDLRFEPTPKWILAERGGEVVVDSRRALLVWPRDHVVPAYAFPAGDVRIEAQPCADPDLHPRDPFHRIDIRRSSRHVVVALGGVAVAESRRPCLLFETGLPVRHYLPPEDIRMDLLEPSGKRTTCAYKGHASYFSADGNPDIAWTYPDPLPDAEQIRGLIAFFDERADVTVDGELQERPKTQWS